MNEHFRYSGINTLKIIYLINFIEKPLRRHNLVFMALETAIVSASIASLSKETLVPSHLF